YKLKTRGVGATGRGLLAGIYKKHPKDMLAQELYAVDLTLHEGSEYLSVEGLKMPRNGKDLIAINSLLGFCRAFVHYRGDIRKKPMPLLNIKPANLFPIPAATSASQAATSESAASR
ncbi:MAG: hypothetical protein ACRDHZ_09960, partial [Ktedonobacteraceae bacterium]